MQKDQPPQDEPSKPETEPYRPEPEPEPLPSPDDGRNYIPGGLPNTIG